jgi:hypothetical protein
MTGTQLKAIKGKILIDGNGGPAVQNPLEGLGLVQGPPIFIATDLAEGRLVTVLDQWAPTPATGFFLYYPSPARCGRILLKDFRLLPGIVSKPVMDIGCGN